MWSALLTLALPLVLGLACGRGRWLESSTLTGEQLVAGLNRFALSVAFPALVLASWIDPSRPTQLELGLALAALLGLAGGVAGALLLGGRAGLPSRGALALIALFGNSAYLGLPLVAALLGEDTLGRASFVVALHVAASVTVGSYLLARDGARDLGARDVLRTLAASPLAWSPLLGALLSFIVSRAGLAEHPATAGSFAALHALGRTASPLGLFVLGLFLGAKREPAPGSADEVRADLSFVLTRLAVVPGCTLAASLVLRASHMLDEEGVRVVVLLSAMPAAISTFAMAHEHGAEPARVARAIVTTTLAAVITIPTWLWLTERALGR